MLSKYQGSQMPPSKEPQPGSRHLIQMFCWILINVSNFCMLFTWLIVEDFWPKFTWLKPCFLKLVYLNIKQCRNCHYVWQILCSFTSTHFKFSTVYMMCSYQENFKFLIIFSDMSLQLWNYMVHDTGFTVLCLTFVV